MTTLWPFPSSYPTALDLFTPVLFDNVDEVIANHPNSLASAIEALQAKLGLDNEVVHDTGGVGFYLTGKAASPGRGTLWMNNAAFAPHFHLYYTDELGTDHDLSAGGGGSIAWGDYLLIFVDSTNGSDAPGVGDGTPEKPYETLAYATSVAVVPLPTDWDEFNTGVQYVLAPGVYDAGGDITLPHRRFIAFTGSRYDIQCIVRWYYDFQYWFHNNPDPHPASSNWQVVEFTTDTPLMSRLTGNFYRKNNAANLTTGNNATLIIEGLELGGDIINEDSGNNATPPGP